jgi:hypothetical protein
MSNPRSWTMALRWYVFWAAVVVCFPAPATASLSSATQSSAAQTDHSSSTNALCNAGKSVCVAPATQGMLLKNPFDIAVTATSGVSDINWELDDQTGQTLAFGKAGDDPDWSSDHTSPPERFRLRAFVFVLPKAASGVLKLSPVRTCRLGGTSNLAALIIPVRFESGPSTLAVLVRKNYEQYQSEAEDWASTHGPPSRFTPKSPFVQERLTVLRVSDVFFASAKAAAEKASVLSQAPVRILNFTVQNGGAYVDLSLNDLQDAWAGISFTIAKVEPLIEKDLSQFPNIHKVVYAWPPGAPDAARKTRRMLARATGAVP